MLLYNFSFYNNFIKKFFIIFIVAFLFFFPFIIDHSYIRHVMIMIFIYSIAAMAWNVLSGYTGQISLGNAIFFGLGTYTSTILYMNFNINPWFGMMAGGLIAVFFGCILGLPLFRARKQYFIIATLAAGEIMRITFLNLDYVKGARGIELPIMTDSFLDMSYIYNKNGFYFISLIILIFFTFIVFLITKTKFGYYFKTIKEEEDAAKSIGINVPQFKLVAISVTAFFTAIAGTIYAQYMRYIDPNMVFSAELSIKILLIAALGGVETLFGPILGSFILIPIIEITRITWGGAGLGLDLFIYSILIIFIAIFKPDGIITIFSSKRNF